MPGERVLHFDPVDLAARQVGARLGNAVSGDAPGQSRAAETLVGGFKMAQKREEIPPLCSTRLLHGDLRGLGDTRKPGVNLAAETVSKSGHESAPSNARGERGDEREDRIEGMAAESGRLDKQTGTQTERGPTSASFGKFWGVGESAVEDTGKRKRADGAAERESLLFEANGQKLENLAKERGKTGEKIAQFSAGLQLEGARARFTASLPVEAKGRVGLCEGRVQKGPRGTEDLLAGEVGGDTASPARGAVLLARSTGAPMAGNAAPSAAKEAGRRLSGSRGGEKAAPAAGQGAPPLEDEDVQSPKKLVVAQNACPSIEAEPGFQVVRGVRSLRDLGEKAERKQRKIRRAARRARKAREAAANGGVGKEGLLGLQSEGGKELEGEEGAAVRADGGKHEGRIGSQEGLTREPQVPLPDDVNTGQDGNGWGGIGPPEERSGRHREVGAVQFKNAGDSEEGAVGGAVKPDERVPKRRRVGPEAGGIGEAWLDNGRVGVLDPITRDGREAEGGPAAALADGAASGAPKPEGRVGEADGGASEAAGRDPSKEASEAEAQENGSVLETKEARKDLAAGALKIPAQPEGPSGEPQDVARCQPIDPGMVLRQLADDSQQLPWSETQGSFMETHWELGWAGLVSKDGKTQQEQGTEKQTEGDTKSAEGTAVEGLGNEDLGKDEGQAVRQGSGQALREGLGEGLGEGLRGDGVRAQAMAADALGGEGLRALPPQGAAFIAALNRLGGAALNSPVGERPLQPGATPLEEGSQQIEEHAAGERPCGVETQVQEEGGWPLGKGDGNALLEFVPETEEQEDEVTADIEKNAQRVRLQGAAAGNQKATEEVNLWRVAPVKNERVEVQGVAAEAADKHCGVETQEELGKAGGVAIQDFVPETEEEEDLGTAVIEKKFQGVNLRRVTAFNEEDKRVDRRRMTAVSEKESERMNRHRAVAGYERENLRRAAAQAAEKRAKAARRQVSLKPAQVPALGGLRLEPPGLEDEESGSPVRQGLELSEGELPSGRDRNRVLRKGIRKRSLLDAFELAGEEARTPLGQRVTTPGEAEPPGVEPGLATPASVQSKERREGRSGHPLFAQAGEENAAELGWVAGGAEGVSQERLKFNARGVFGLQVDRRAHPVVAESVQPLSVLKQDVGVLKETVGVHGKASKNENVAAGGVALASKEAQALRVGDCLKGGLQRTGVDEPAHRPPQSGTNAQAPSYAPPTTTSECLANKSGVRETKGRVSLGSDVPSLGARSGSGGLDIPPPGPVRLDSCTTGKGVGLGEDRGLKPSELEANPLQEKPDIGLKKRGPAGLADDGVAVGKRARLDGTGPVSNCPGEAAVQESCAAEAGGSVGLNTEKISERGIRGGTELEAMGWRDAAKSDTGEEIGPAKMALEARVLTDGRLQEEGNTADRSADAEGGNTRLTELAEQGGLQGEGQTGTVGGEPDKVPVYGEEFPDLDENAFWAFERTEAEPLEEDPTQKDDPARNDDPPQGDDPPREGDPPRKDAPPQKDVVFSSLEKRRPAQLVLPMQNDSQEELPSKVLQSPRAPNFHNDATGLPPQIDSREEAEPAEGQPAPAPEIERTPKDQFHYDVIGFVNKIGGWAIYLVAGIARGDALEEGDVRPIAYGSRRLLMEARAAIDNQAKAVVGVDLRTVSEPNLRRRAWKMSRKGQEYTLRRLAGSRMSKSAQAALGSACSLLAENESQEGAAEKGRAGPVGESQEGGLGGSTPRDPDSREGGAEEGDMCPPDQMEVFYEVPFEGRRPRRQRFAKTALAQVAAFATRVEKWLHDPRCSICQFDIEGVVDLCQTEQCGHIFHRPCLLNWLVSSNSCPTCRARIPVFEGAPIEHKDLKPSFDEDAHYHNEFADVMCEVCTLDEAEEEDGNHILICDNCDKGYHLWCIGLAAVPEGDWYCPPCQAAFLAACARLDEPRLASQNPQRQSRRTAQRRVVPTQRQAPRRAGDGNGRGNGGQARAPPVLEELSSGSEGEPEMGTPESPDLADDGMSPYYRRSPRLANSRFSPGLRWDSPSLRGGPGGSREEGTEGNGLEEPLLGRRQTRLSSGGSGQGAEDLRSERLREASERVVRGLEEARLTREEKRERNLAEIARLQQVAPDADPDDDPLSRIIGKQPAGGASEQEPTERVEIEAGGGSGGAVSAAPAEPVVEKAKRGKIVRKKFGPELPKACPRCKKSKKGGLYCLRVHGGRREAEAPSDTEGRGNDKETKQEKRRAEKEDGVQNGGVLKRQRNGFAGGAIELDEKRDASHQDPDQERDPGNDLDTATASEEEGGSGVHAGALYGGGRGEPAEDFEEEMGNGEEEDRERGEGENLLFRGRGPSIAWGFPVAHFMGAL